MTRFHCKETLMKLCINHNMCNDCTNKQYEKMLNLAAEAFIAYEGDPEATETMIGNLADIIYILTQDADAFVIYGLLEGWLDSLKKEV